MVKTVQIVFLLFFFGCQLPTESADDCNDCGLYIYSELPQDENGVYQLSYDTNRVMTYTMLYAETNCGWSKRIAWDTNYQYRINTDWVSLVNPASMTDDEGVGRIIFGTWRDFIGYTITCYGGYVDECDNHYVDSIQIKVN